MKSEKAKEVLARSYDGGHICFENAERAVELAEQEAEERMLRKAAKVFCAANCPKGCPFGADGNIGCAAKDRFIQKLNEE